MMSYDAGHEGRSATHDAAQLARPRRRGDGPRPVRAQHHRVAQPAMADGRRAALPSTSYAESNALTLQLSDKFA